MRRVIVTGSRKWIDIQTLYATLRAEWIEHGNFVLVHGACPTGADYMADQWADWSTIFPGFDIVVERYPADWERFGPAAGPKRNQKMVDSGADICIAFPLDDSRGTLDCIRRARAAKIPIKVVHQDSASPDIKLKKKK